MDSLDLETSSMKFPNFDDFRASCSRQHFSLPESIMFYISKKFSSVKLYQKLIKSCKYFFIKNPILILRCLSFDDQDGWKTCIDGSCFKSSNFYKLDLNQIQCKICVTLNLKISSSNPKIASSLFPKFCNGFVRSFNLSGQKIAFNEFLYFSKGTERLTLLTSTVFYENGTVVSCDSIIASIPKLEMFQCTIDQTVPSDFKNTVTEFLKIPHFKNLKYFKLYGISESFDIEKFYDYLKKHQKTLACLTYYGTLSEEYKQKLEAFVDEVLAVESDRKSFTTFIDFMGQSRDKRNAVYNLVQKDLKTLF